VPRSRVRKKAVYTPPPDVRPVGKKRRPSPRWLAPLMLTLFLLGIAWLAVYYITQGELVGMRALDAWNLAVGFGFIVAGFLLSTQWR